MSIEVRRLTPEEVIARKDVREMLYDTAARDCSLPLAAAMEYFCKKSGLKLLGEHDDPHQGGFYAAMGKAGLVAVGVFDTAPDFSDLGRTYVGENSGVMWLTHYGYDEKLGLPNGGVFGKMAHRAKNELYCPVRRELRKVTHLAALLGKLYTGPLASNIETINPKEYGVCKKVSKEKEVINGIPGPHDLHFVKFPDEKRKKRPDRDVGARVALGRLSMPQGRGDIKRELVGAGR